jgi:hypothetical protein
LINPFWNKNDFNGLPKIAACAEPCPDDRTGYIQYQDKEDRKKVNTNEGEAYKDSVPELSNVQSGRVIVFSVVIKSI